MATYGSEVRRVPPSFPSAPETVESV